MNTQSVRSGTLAGLILLSLLIAGCAGHMPPQRSSAVEFLYPAGAEARPPADVELRLPVRVGLAFPPGTTQRYQQHTLSEQTKQALLQRIAANFADNPHVSSVDIIPSTYLNRKGKGGFENLDRLSQAFGIDLMVLVSYEQVQFTETGTSSWAYWTLVGAYVVKGEKNETRTVIDAAVFDIPSRTLLFRAPGESRLSGSSTPVDHARYMRLQSEEGFSAATDNLISNLQIALAEFEVQAAVGRVRGLGTPEIRVTDDRPVATGPGHAGGGLGGGFGLFELALFAGLGLVALGQWTRMR